MKVFILLLLINISININNINTQFTNIEKSQLHSTLLTSSRYSIVLFNSTNEECTVCQSLNFSEEKTAHLSNLLSPLVNLFTVDTNSDKKYQYENKVFEIPLVKIYSPFNTSVAEYDSDISDSEELVPWILTKLQRMVKSKSKGENYKDTDEIRNDDMVKSTHLPDNVIVLNQSNFNEKVIENNEDVWVVEFYAPWCGYCKEFESEYKKAAILLKSYAKLAKVDGTLNNQLLADYNIDGYPTILVFGKDKSKSPVEWTQGDNAIDLNDFIINNYVVNSEEEESSDSDNSNDNKNDL